MALLWCDGFDHYGTGSTGRDNMLDGPYAQVSGAGVSPSSARPRTGTSHLRIGFGTDHFIRRVFGADKVEVGIGYAFFIPSLPMSNNQHYFAVFRDNANNSQCSITLTTTGQLRFHIGQAGTVIAETGVVISTGAYNHFEAKVRIGDEDGSCEIRINGVTVLDVAGVDTKNLTTDTVAQVVIGFPILSPNASTWDVDDLFCWDTLGPFNNDFLGDRQVHTLFPNEDTLAADWQRNSESTDFGQIDEVTPDDDTTYVAADTPGDISEYGLQDLPADVSAVSAIYTTPRMRKTDAGMCNVQISMVSSGVGSPPAPAEANGADRPITEEYAYWPDVFEFDPATGAPWTREAVNDALFKIERTA